MQPVFVNRTGALEQVDRISVENTEYLLESGKINVKRLLWCDLYFILMAFQNPRVKGGRELLRRVYELIDGVFVTGRFRVIPLWNENDVRRP